MILIMLAFLLQNHIPLEYGMERDIVLLMRFLTIIISFYLAYQTSKKIGETEFISGTTGISLYMIGSGIYQIGLTSTYVYADSSVKDGFFVIFYLATSYIYLVTMAIFTIFTELEQQKKFPAKSGEKYPFKWSIISIIIVIISILIVHLINTEMINFAFLLMVIPFIITSLKFMARFQNLEILKEDSPRFWFGTGLSIAGFSNFLFFLDFNIYLIISIQSIMVIVGTLLIAKAWAVLPPLSELHWYLNLNRLLVIQRSSSLVIHSYLFHIDVEDDMNGDTASILAGGALSGVQSILNEILKSESGIKVIDHGDKSIYFHHNEICTFVLFTSGKAEELSERLQHFSIKFMNKFHTALTNWNGRLDVFNNTREITKEVFTHLHDSTLTIK